MERDYRLRLNMLSLAAFGVKSRWKTILNRGTFQDGRWHALTEKEVEDTMLYIIKSREDHNERVRQESESQSSNSTDASEEVGPGETKD